MSEPKITIQVPEDSGWTIEQQGTDIKAEYYKPTLKERLSWKLDNLRWKILGAFQRMRNK